MYPILFKVGPLVIYSYGFFLAVAYLAATFVFYREGRKRGFNEEKLLDFSVVALIAAIVGGRIFYTLLNLKLFSQEPLKIFAIWEGGFAYYGAFILVFIVCSYLVRRWRWDFFQVADFASLSVLIAIFFGKIGSFLSGNDYGKLTLLPWGVSSEFLEGTRHPVQLYEAFWALILLLLLWRLYQKNLKKTFDLRSGAVFLYFVLFTSLGRVVFEQFRGDSSYLGLFPMATVFAFMLAGTSLLVLYYYQFRNIKADIKTVGRYILGINLRRFRKPQRLSERQ